MSSILLKNHSKLTDFRIFEVFGGFWGLLLVVVVFGVSMEGKRSAKSASRPRNATH